MNEKCYALICDAVGSMKLSRDEWELLDERLNLTKKVISAYFQTDLCSDVILSGGDGLEALFTNLNSCAEAFYLISSIMFPFKMRGGIGAGHVSKKTVNANTVDCPGAFFKARSALNATKEDEKTLYFYIDSFSDDTNYGGLINSSFSLLSLLTKHQREVFNLFCFLSPVSNSSRPSFLKPLLLQKFIGGGIENGLSNIDKQVYVKTINEIKKRELEMLECKYSFPPFMNVIVANLCSSSRQNISKAKKSGIFDIIKTMQVVSLDLISDYDHKNK